MDNQIELKIAVVQAYCNHCTGKTPDVNLKQFADISNIMKLESAYIQATNFFSRNHGSIQLIHN